MVSFSISRFKSLIFASSALLYFSMIKLSSSLKVINSYFLSGSQGPLLQLFLVPVHLQFEFIQFLISFENQILLIVQSLLLLNRKLLQFPHFRLDSTHLSFRNLFQMVFSLDLLILSLD